MRVPTWFAWVLLGLGLFTSGLIRQFNADIPISPYVDPVVGSLLFAAILFMLLVTAREHRIGAVGGSGVRIGSLTPILLILFIEKWISLSLYNPAFAWLAPTELSSEALDARFRAFAGAGLLLVCLLVSRFTSPTSRKTWRRARSSRWPLALVQCSIVVAGTYLILGGLSWALGGGLKLRWPKPDALWIWVICGQAFLAFAEEVYYRGLILCEMERLAPRLGARSPAARRWTALLSSALVFGLEHMRLSASAEDPVRQLIFTVSLAVLFGLLVMISANLHLAAGIHAWINWLLLGAAPIFVDATGKPALPSGIYIGLTLMLVFVLAFAFRGVRHLRLANAPHTSRLSPEPR